MQGYDLGRVLERTTRGLSCVGRRLSLDWLVYNPIEFYRYHLYARSAQDAVADAIIETFPDASSFVDVGAGTGTFAAALKRRGRRVAACEWSPWGRLFGLAQGIRAERFDLRRLDPAPYPQADVAYCFEVAEHLPAVLGDRLVVYLAHYPVVVFSAAHPEQGGHEHINEQPKTYWVERFAAQGMVQDDARGARLVERFASKQAPWWLVDNTMVLARTVAVAR
jgi:SAM-dependent methyltransferase